MLKQIFSNFRIFDSHRRSIASFLANGLGVDPSRSLTFQSAVDGALSSETLLSLHSALPSVDSQTDRLEEGVFSLLRHNPSSDTFGQGGMDFAGDWIVSGIITMKALFPLSVDPVLEQQITRECLLYQVLLHYS